MDKRKRITWIFCCSRWAARSSSWVWAVMVTLKKRSWFLGAVG